MYKIMFALVSACGRQYKAELNSTLVLDSMNANIGDIVELKPLLIADENSLNIASSNASVKAKVLEHFKGEKVVIFKKRRRKHYDKKTGFRASLTKVLVTEINQ